MPRRLAPAARPSAPLPHVHPLFAGATWADQLLQPCKYANRLWTVAVLALLTGVYVVMSLLPLMDPWYQAAALLTGGCKGQGV